MAIKTIYVLSVWRSMLNAVYTTPWPLVSNTRMEESLVAQATPSLRQHMYGQACISRCMMTPPAPGQMYGQASISRCTDRPPPVQVRASLHQQTYRPPPVQVRTSLHQHMYGETPASTLTDKIANVASGQKPFHHSNRILIMKISAETQMFGRNHRVLSPHFNCTLSGFSRTRCPGKNTATPFTT